MHLIGNWRLVFCFYDDYFVKYALLYKTKLCPTVCSHQLIYLCFYFVLCYLHYDLMCVCIYTCFTCMTSCWTSNKSFLIWVFMGFPGGSVVKKKKNCLPMQEMWVRSQGWEDHLEKEMGTHSNILAWKIPWTEKLARLQSLGLQRTEQDWARMHISMWLFKKCSFFTNNEQSEKEI